MLKMLALTKSLWIFAHSAIWMSSFAALEESFVRMIPDFRADFQVRAKLEPPVNQNYTSKQRGSRNRPKHELINN